MKRIVMTMALAVTMLMGAQRLYAQDVITPEKQAEMKAQAKAQEEAEKQVKKAEKEAGCEPESAPRVGQQTDYIQFEDVGLNDNLRPFLVFRLALTRRREQFMKEFRDDVRFPPDRAGQSDLALLCQPAKLDDGEIWQKLRCLARVIAAHQASFRLSRRDGPLGLRKHHPHRSLYLLRHPLPQSLIKIKPKLTIT